MKILVMSDTHGIIDFAEDLISKLGKIDLLIHLGDHYQDAVYLGKKLNIKVAAVKGNCDSGEVEKEKVLDIGEHKLFLTHGHEYGVKSNLTRIYYKALELNCNIALFGHTHMPVKIKHDEIFIMNPGSFSMPRGVAKASYGILEIEKNNVNGYIVEV